MGVQIQVHFDAESFSDATGTGKDTRGVYDPSTKTIHLNPNSSVKDVMEEFGHAAFRSILKSDSKFAKRVYENILSEAGMGQGAFGRIDPKTGMIVLPEDFREEPEFLQLAQENPFALSRSIKQRLFTQTTTTLGEGRRQYLRHLGSTPTTPVNSTLRLDEAVGELG